MNSDKRTHPSNVGDKQPVIYAGNTSRYSRVLVWLFCTAIVVAVSTLFTGVGFGGKRALTALQWAGVAAGAAAIVATIVVSRSGIQTITIVAWDSGLTVERGDSSQEWEWHTIDQVYLHDVTLHRGIKVELRSSTGEELTLTEGIPRVRELVTTILAETTSRKLELIRKVVDSGKSTSLGPLVFDRTGIGRRRKKLGWDELRNFEVHVSHSPLTPRGTMLLTLWKERQFLSWTSLPISEIPNVFVLLQFLAEACPQESSDRLGPLQPLSPLPIR